jgi:hypothetical protein
MKTVIAFLFSSLALADGSAHRMVGKAKLAFIEQLEKRTPYSLGKVDSIRFVVAELGFHGSHGTRIEAEVETTEGTLHCKMDAHYDNSLNVSGVSPSSPQALCH